MKDILIASVLVGVCGGLVGCGSLGSGGPDALPAALHERAVAVLRDAVENETEWVRVHAAEALVWNGYADEVRPVFLAEVDSAGPKHRIGVWRVLAQAAPNAEEREQYTARIRQAFLDKDGPDRLHAIETLGKLNDGERSDALAEAARGEDEFGAYARWVMANGGDAQDEAALVALVDSDDEGVRSTVGYALRFFDHVRPATLPALSRAVRNEPKDSPARNHLVSAWFVHCPEAQEKAARKRLLAYAGKGSTAERFEMCNALARRGDASDIAMLERLLGAADADVRIGAAHALLSIGARL
ncbi:MAG: hypothetical protein JXR94_10915 [Candidatus Hydrogenedentes bacterium]|nr:hypothetical protein [Candidatus Hydrogenedentota bacterium]